MSHSRFLTAAVALVIAAPVAAQLRPYVAIERARVGFRPGQFAGEQDAQGSSAVAKKWQWAPVSFELKVLRKLDPEARLAMRLRVEGRDADETRYTAYYKLGSPLNDRTPPPTDQTGKDTTRAVNEIVYPAELPLRACVRPGGGNGDVTLTVVTDVPAGERADDISDPVKVDGGSLRRPSTYVVLSLGSNLPGFDLADPNGGEAQANRGPLRGGRVETAVLDSVAEMPDHWFAYEAADLVVLPTAAAPPGFLEQLFDAREAGPGTIGERKREALLEWVRRGGKLLVTVGRDGNKLKQDAFKSFTDLLPVALSGDGRVEVTKRELTYATANGTPAVDVLFLDKNTRAPTGQPFWVATLEAKQGGRPPIVLSRESGRGGQSGPIVAAQAPFGMGRVTAIGMDLDAAPFALLLPQYRQAVWDWLLRTAGSERAAESAAERDRRNNLGGLSPTEQEDGALAALRRQIDEFEGVPVISFGWVALFILLYTLLIGPVEYLFLKKILGRLELTWVTFPIIVLSVSAAAYFTAYAIKGKDLRINKIDIVDIDLGTQRVYGRTYFTVFSPRVDSYTVGIEPKAPWAAEPAYGERVPPTLVDWVGGVRTGGGSAGYRAYRYDLDDTGTAASGLGSVPIAVWSTKTFTANWSAPFDPKAPPVTAALRHPVADATAAAGEITAHLPFGNFQEGFVFFAGDAYPLKPMPVGQPVRFDSTGRTVANWETQIALFDGKFRVDDSGEDGNRGRGARPGVAAPNAPVGGPLSLWGVLLGDRAVKHSGFGPQNASLRTLDQSWRLSKDNREEVIIIAKLPREPKPALAGQTKADPSLTAEQLMTDPTSSSPTKLWLRGLPGLDEKGNRRTRAEVPGFLTQDTYVRIYIPVQPAGGK